MPELCRPPIVWRIMMLKKTGLRTGLVAGAAFAVLLAAGTAHSLTRSDYEVRTLLTASAAEELFADAPAGVDPMVTGPVSASFKKRQRDAGCDRAVWPNVPGACYPN